jgi:actin-related protein
MGELKRRPTTVVQLLQVSITMVIASTTSMSSSSTRRSRITPRFPKVGRAPVILEFTSTTCRAGYAGDAQPRRQVILPLKNKNATANNNNNTATDSLTDILASYHVAARLMQDVFDQLGQDPSERHCLIVTQGLYPVNHTDQEKRLQQVLWNLGVPAVRFLPSLQHVALALVSPSPASTSAPTTGLVCLVTPSETHCVVFSSDAVLPFTYQVLPTTNSDSLDNTINSSQIMTALLKCLQACPRDLRKGAAANLSFAGEVCTQQPDLGRQLARQLKMVLSSPPSQQQQEPLASEQEPENDPAETTTTNAVLPYSYTTVPVAVSQLRVLADLIAVVQLPYRPDLCTWIGVSLWAAAWHGRLSTGSTPAHTTSTVSKTLTGSTEEPPSEASVFAWTKRPE